jgi:cytochrome o ubiquinol oxidase subunit IV
MTTVHGNIQSHRHSNGPWPQIIGLILSVVLTLVALWLVLIHALSQNVLLFIILALAVAQIFVQLFFFMHITEGAGPKWHVWMLAVGMLLVVTIVAGSIWVMSFGAESY